MSTVPRLIGQRVKKPSEVRTLTFNFTDKLVDGDSLTGSATMTYASGLTEVLTSRTGNIVKSRFTGGAEDTSYAVRCQCGTTSGDTLQLDVTVFVESDLN